MGQKANPVGLRLGIVREWDSIWWNEKKLGSWVVEDEKIRNLIHKRSRNAEVERVKIERTPGLLKIIIRTGKPALLIGQKGSEIEALKKELVKIVADRKNAKIDIKIEEVKKTNMSAQIIGTNLALQIERNFPYKRAMKKIMGDCMKDGVKGIKIMVAGRVGGSEMARTEWYSNGRIPTQTLRADIDYATAEAKTKYGIIGIKVWLFRGEILGKKSLFTETATTPERPKRKRKPSSDRGPSKKEDIVLKKRRSTKKTEE
jgi:small subunit ribosomal protein S3